MNRLDCSYFDFIVHFFRFAPFSESPFLVPVVRTGFKLVVFAGVTVKVEDFLSIFRHNASLSETEASFDKAFGPPLPSAEAAPDDPASATSYRYPKNILGLPIVESERELVQVQGQVFLADIVIVPITPRLSKLQKFSTLFVWTSPRTYSPSRWRTTGRFL